MDETDRNMVEFLENWPPFRMYRKPVAQYVHAIHMPCFKCGSEQTFVNAGSVRNDDTRWDYYQTLEDPFRVELARYICAGCRDFGRLFVLMRDHPTGQRPWIRKIGQKPDWRPRLEKHFEAALGTHATIFKKGLDCEQSGYGIGAYAYYRRIVEDIIDDLLALVEGLLPEGDEKKKYVEALAKTKTSRVAEEKIALVKDLLPASLRPGGINPLDILHDALSEGLHEKTDDECLDLAGATREGLGYLVDQLKRTQEAQRTFTDSMKKFLERKVGLGKPAGSLPAASKAPALAAPDSDEGNERPPVGR